MRTLTKKIMIYSMVGLMQVGLGATVVAASPLYNDNGEAQRIVQLDDGYGYGDRHHEHDRRQREEMRRHEREMRRYDRESDRDWNDRQWRENQRHEQCRQDIERQYR